MGQYGERFGLPELTIEICDEKIASAEVIRGAPCGATWKAARRIIGLDAAAAVRRIGLEVQFFCTANPSAWDPIYEHSPVHYAGEFHIAAVRRALKAQKIKYFLTRL